MNIQITGASGSGKTYLGRKLAKKIEYEFVDVDDLIWVWDEDIQPYTMPVSTEVSFDLLIVVETDDKIRKKRLIKREYKMYGNRAKKGGDMFEQFNRFLNWAMSYEYSQSISGSRFETDKWALKFEDRVLYIDGSWPLYKKIKVIQKKLRSLK